MPEANLLKAGAAMIEITPPAGRTWREAGPANTAPPKP